MKKIYSLTILLLGMQLHSNALVRGAEFSHVYLGGNTFEVQVRIYTDGVNDPPSIPFCWGDGVCDTLYRVSSESIAACSNYAVVKDVYQGTHTYATYGIYGLVMQVINRVDSIVNINFGNSDEVPLFVTDTLLFYDPAKYGPVNSSPELPSYAVDFGYVGTVFHHYPAAYDPDGDSLSFQFYTPLQAPLTPVPNWVNPDSVMPIPPDSLSIDPVTGEVTWNEPHYQGYYNIGILITKYRKSYYNSTPPYFVIDKMMRDLQIIIGLPLATPPVITALNDTCIIAGANIKATIMATVPDTNHITLTAGGGSFYVMDTASFTQTVFDTGISMGIFQWQTICDDSRNNYYQILIRATDDYNCTVTTTGVWNVKVSAPPPQQLIAIATSDSTELSWQNPYTCDTSYSKKFIGFSVWRRVGSNPFIVDSCVNGLAGQGYTEIAHQVMANNFSDYTSVAGTQYCYRVLGEFGYATSLGYVFNVVRSLASNETCVVSMDTNLSVQNIAEAEINLSLFPNPVTDMLDINVKGATTETEIDLYDLLGEKLLSYIEPAGYVVQKNINLSSFADGMYIVTIHVNGNEYNRKVVKQ